LANHRGILNVALKYPDTAAKFVACDTQAKSPEANIKAWDEYRKRQILQQYRDI
jgi:hypothetical protein